MNELKRLQLLRAHLNTVVNAIDVYEKCDLKEEWGFDFQTKKEIALRTIENRLYNATQLLGIKPEKKK